MALIHYALCMSYVTVEVEIEHGRIVTRELKMLPVSGEIVTT